MKTNVSVVIPNWNGADFLADCLHSLEAQTLKPHIIVVDNGSVDDSLALIEKQFPKVQVIKLPSNRGFTGGVNAGIKASLQAGDKFVALFNNDAHADKKWLETLVDTAQAHPDTGIVTGKFMRLDKKHIDSTGDVYTIWGVAFPRGRNEADHGQYDNEQYVFGATGGATLYRTVMLQEIGLFDDDFFAYLEDIDISFRAQLAGWKVRYQPKALAYHHVSATSGKYKKLHRFHSTKNFYLTYLKNMPSWLFWLYLPTFFVGGVRTFVATIFKSGSLVAYLHAIWVVLLSLPATLKKRRRIQKQRTVSSGYINSLLVRRLPGLPRHLK